MCDAIRIAHPQIASDAKTHSLDLKSQENARKKRLRKSCDVGLRCEKSGCFLRSSDAKCLRFGLSLRFGLRCERPRCQIASDVGRAMRTTKSVEPFKTSTKCQDKFDHDKGQKSPISGRRLHWRLFAGFFAFSPVFMCNLVRRAPLKSGESSEKCRQWRKSRKILSRLWLSWFFRP